MQILFKKVQSGIVWFLGGSSSSLLNEWEYWSLSIDNC